MSSTFNPSDASTSVGFYNAGQPPSTWEYFRFNTATIAPETTSLDPTTLNPGGVQTQPASDGFSIGGIETETNLSPLDHFVLLAAALGKFDVADVTPAVSQRFRLSELGGTDAPSRFLALRHNRANSLTERYPKVGLSQFTVSHAAGQAVKFAVSGAAEEFTRWGVPVRTVGTLTPIPNLRGITDYAHSVLADGEVFVVVDSIASLPNSIDVKVKVGTAASYTGAAQTIPVGVWTTLNDESDAPIGPPGARTQIYFSTLTGSTATDEFSVTRDGDVPTIALPATGIEFGRINATLAFGDNEECVESWQITATLPLQERTCVSGGFNRGGLQYMGDVVYELTFERQHVDTTWIRRMENAEPFAVRITLDSGVAIAGGGGETYQVDFVAKAAVHQGSQPVISDVTSFSEPITATLYQNADGTYPAPLVAEIITDRTSIGAP